MFYVLSKAFWVLARPLNALFLLALLGGLFALFGWKRTARTAFAVSALGFAAIGFTQLPDFLLLKLETVVATAPLPATPAGIVVLGGGLAAESAAMPTGHHFGEASDRIVKGLELHRLYPQARFVFSGGLSDLLGRGEPETSAAASAIRALYGDERGVEFEDRSRSTWENAVETAKLAGPGGSGQWLLVTSAFHMPRALGSFRAAGMDVVPVPTDFRADPLRPPFLVGDMAGQFLKMNILVKELFGLAAYRMTGRTPQFLPR